MAFAPADDINDIWLGEVKHKLCCGLWLMLHAKPINLQSNLGMMLANWKRICIVCGNQVDCLFFSFFKLVAAASRTIKLNYYNFNLICATCTHTQRAHTRTRTACEKSQVHKFRNNQINVKCVPPK